MEYFGEELTKPVSPMGLYFDSTSLCVYILAVLEFEVPIHDLPIVSLVKDAFRSAPRFTSIMVDDEEGVKRWKRVDVKLEEHFVEPKFIEGMSLDSYDKHFGDYLSRIAMEKLPKTKPLWQVHVIKYPTSNAKGTLVLKFHHAIGDGYTLMGLLLSTLQRADNPSLPLSFPSLKTSKRENTNKFFLKRILKFLSMTFNSFSEFGWSVLKSTLVEDDKTPIRSGVKQFESGSTVISNITFPMDHIKEIKSKLGVTVNDVMMGIIFYGIRLYMQDIDKKSRAASVTALVASNTRNVDDYHRVEDMLKTEKCAWGNNFAFFHVSMPKLEDTKVSNPLQFVKEAHTSMKKKKNSFASLLTRKLLLIKNKFRGPEAVGEHFLKTVRNSSLVVSNMTGPLGQMAWGNHPIKGFFFTISGIPKILMITIMSYMGMVRVTLGTEGGFIDEQKLIWYLNNAFDLIRQEAAKENIPK